MRLDEAPAQGCVVSIGYAGRAPEMIKMLVLTMCPHRAAARFLHSCRHPQQPRPATDPTALALLVHGTLPLAPFVCVPLLQAALQQLHNPSLAKRATPFPTTHEHMRT